MLDQSTHFVRCMGPLGCNGGFAPITFPLFQGIRLGAGQRHCPDLSWSYSSLAGADQDAAGTTRVPNLLQLTQRTGPGGFSSSPRPCPMATIISESTVACSRMPSTALISELASFPSRLSKPLKTSFLSLISSPLAAAAMRLMRL